MRAERASACRRAAAALLAGLVLAASCRPRPEFSYDFERDADLDRLPWKCRTLLRLSDRHATSGAMSLEVGFFPDRSGGTEHYPGLTLSGFSPDWSARRALVFDAYNPEPAPLPLSVRIDDREDAKPAERFAARLAIAPGPNRIVLPLQALVTAGTGRRLDLRAVRQVILFLANPVAPHTLYLDRIRLE